jgi:Phosphotransferase enzyme family
LRSEPAIDRPALAATIRGRYGLSADELTFVPAGQYATCYVVRSGNERHFLKIWPKPLPTYVSTESTLAMLRLTRAMHERRAFMGFAYPLPTVAGELSGLFEGRLMALFPFVQGAAPQVSAEYATTLGHRVAQLHRSTAVLGDVLPSRETFAIPFEEDLRRELGLLARIGSGDRATRQAVRDLILPIRSDLLRLLDRLHELQQNVSAIGAPFVLCHRDIGVHNLLEDGEGRLHLIDWDDVGMAPPEHDLFSGRGRWFPAFLHGYLTEGGTENLHIDAFAFVLVRRILDDVSFDLVAMSADETGDGDAHTLGILERFVVPEWRAHERTLSEIREALAEAGI